MVHTLIETDSRVSAFCRLRAEALSLAELEIHILGKGGKPGDVPILRSLAKELQLHLNGRNSGYVFPSPLGAHYSSRQVSRS